MAESWRSGTVRTTPSADTIADGIAVRIPVPEALVEMADCGDEMILVGEERLLEAMRLIHEEMGLVAEPAPVARVAAALDFRERLIRQLLAPPVCWRNLTLR